MIYIINQATQILANFCYPIKQTKQLAMLDAQAWQTLIYHIEQNLNDNLGTFKKFSKSRHMLNYKTI